MFALLLLTVFIAGRSFTLESKSASPWVAKFLLGAPAPCRSEGIVVNRRTFQVAVLTLLLTTGISPSFSQTTSELMDFLSQRLGLSRDQIVAIQQGKPFATNMKPRSDSEVFL